MLIELMVQPLLFMIKNVIRMIPQSASLPEWGTYAVDLIAKGLSIFPASLWFIVFSNIVFWITLQLTWAIIEWVYKKIPGVS